MNDLLYRKEWIGIGLASLLAALLSLSAAQAVTFTWDGGGGANTHWNLSANWAGDPVAPLFTSNNNTDDLVFGSTYTSQTVTLRLNVSGDVVRSITFNAGAPA
jgi:hypothetical protein